MNVTAVKSSLHANYRMKRSPRLRKLPNIYNPNKDTIKIPKTFTITTRPSDYGNFGGSGSSGNSGNSDGGHAYLCFCMCFILFALFF